MAEHGSTNSIGGAQRISQLGRTSAGHAKFMDKRNPKKQQMMSLEKIDLMPSLA